jgi:hypothetical protein
LKKVFRSFETVIKNLVFFSTSSLPAATVRDSPPRLNRLDYNVSDENVENQNADCGNKTKRVKLSGATPAKGLSTNRPPLRPVQGRQSLGEQQ